MKQIGKLITLVIFSFPGILYGAEYDIKTITTIMDAYESQIDSIKLEYNCTYPPDEQGNREFIKGTFAQKKSEGYVLLDERKQKGKTWDDNKDPTGIARSYDGQITRYLEHEKNAHDYHMAALYKNHNPKLYKTIENPYYCFYRVNYATKLTDLLNDPNRTAKIEGEELVDGFNTIKISLKTEGESFDRYVWLLPEKNYLPIRYKLVRTADRSNFLQIDWSEFKELAGGIWHSEKIEICVTGASPITIKVEEIDVSPLTKEDFQFKFPAFTHVTDHIIGTKYLTTETMNTSGIEDAPLAEKPLSNNEKGKVLDKYLDSSKISDNKDSDVIDTSAKPGSKANLKEKSTGVPYWAIMLTFVFVVGVIIFVFAKRGKA